MGAVFFETIMETYSEQTVDFLWSLRLNNSREWFQAHKGEYEALMLRPTKALANSLYDHVADTFPKHSWNLHISRIYRDARRLYGRGPMNDHLWFTLFADQKEDGAPAFYFSFFPEGYHYGLGFWSSHNVLMDRFRAQVAKDPAPAEKLARRFHRQDTFTLDGEPYKKHKMLTTPLLQDWVDRKYLGFICQHEHDALGFSEDLGRVVSEGFDFLMPYHDYFLTLPELEETV